MRPIMASNRPGINSPLAVMEAPSRGSGSGKQPTGSGSALPIGRRQGGFLQFYFHNTQDASRTRRSHPSHDEPERLRKPILNDDADRAKVSMVVSTCPFRSSDV